jgi:hypothetical protein
MTKRPFDKLDPELLESMERERQVDEIRDEITYLGDEATRCMQALRRISVAKSLEDAVKIAKDAMRGKGREAP